MTIVLISTEVDIWLLFLCTSHCDWWYVSINLQTFSQPSCESIYEFWGLHGSDVSSWGLLGCDTV